MDIKLLITKYENEIKELLDYKKKLVNEYCKNTSDSVKASIFNVMTKVNTLQKVIIDLKNI